MRIVEEEVKEVLSREGAEPLFEQAVDTFNSPLNEPVAENEIGLMDNAFKEENNTEGPTVEDESESSTYDPMDFSHFEKDSIAEQDIYSGGGNGVDEEGTVEEEPGLELPGSHARLAADAILGMTDNMIGVGGGFFIKIRKHRDFYDFQEVVQVIEEQNEKNVKRLKLDEEDKVLLRPLLIAVLKRKAKKLTPEQQLMGAGLSILLKKVQMAMEIRAENEIMIDRIREVIRQEKKGTEVEPQKEASEEETEKEHQHQEEVEKEVEEGEVYIEEEKEESDEKATVIDFSKADSRKNKEENVSADQTKSNHRKSTDHSSHPDNLEFTDRPNHPGLDSMILEVADEDE